MNREQENPFLQPEKDSEVLFENMSNKSINISLEPGARICTGSPVVGQEMKGKILYDKITKREARPLWFTDQEGNNYIDTDPCGVDMGGILRIKRLQKDDPRYEVRDYTPVNNIHPL